MFNNGTIHINITLPTKLDINCKIENKIEFIDKHRNFIRLVQYIEPILLCVYGTRDPFSEYDNRFSSSSQRCAISRYIGIGTYDTDEMKTGKILQENIENIVVAREEWGWYNKYYRNCAYKKLDKLGMDINFNKHYNHGVEIRFFDFIPEEKYEELCKFITWLIYISSKKTLMNPIYIPEWNNMVIDSFTYGQKWELSNEQQIIYKEIFGHIHSKNVIDIYNELYSKINSNESDEFRKKIKNSECCSIL
jgi:hypothetical protein